MVPNYCAALNFWHQFLFTWLSYLRKNLWRCLQ